MNTLIGLARDSLFSLILHLAPRLANVLLFIFIGRLAGPSEAGVFTLATTYLIIFTVVMRGLDDLVIRQVSREPDEASHYLTSFLLLRLGLAFLSYGVLSFVVLIVFEYTKSTTVTLLILALSVIPDSLACVAQAVLLGKRRFSAPAVTLALTSAFKLTGGVLVLLTGGKLQQVAWVWCVGSLLGMIVLLLITFKQTTWPQPVAWIGWDPLVRNWRAALTFLSITTLMTLEGQADIVILGAFHDDAELGWYGAATTIAFSLTLLCQAYQFAVYPLMTRYASQEPDKLPKLYKRSVWYLGAVVLPMVSGIALLSPQIVSLVFGPEFQPTVKALRILIFSLIFIFLSTPDSRMMLVHNRQNWSWLFVAGSVVVNVLLNLVLDPYGGASGAAMARLCSSALFFLLNHLYVTRFFVHPDTVDLLSKPVMATLTMTGVVWAVRTWPLPVAIGIGIVVYVGILWCWGDTLPNDAALLHRAIIERRTHPDSEGV